MFDLIENGDRIAKEFFPKRLPAARVNYSAWTQRVEVYLSNNPVALVRFRHAEPVLQVPSGMPSNTGAQWAKLRGQLAVLIELANERQHQKRDEVMTLKPGVWGLAVDLKAAWRKLMALWQKPR
jgi:hypothetical protein